MLLPWGPFVFGTPLHCSCWSSQQEAYTNPDPGAWGLNLPATAPVKGATRQGSKGTGAGAPRPRGCNGRAHRARRERPSNGAAGAADGQWVGVTARGWPQGGPPPAIGVVGGRSQAGSARAPAGRGGRGRGAYGYGPRGAAGRRAGYLGPVKVGQGRSNGRREGLSNREGCSGSKGRRRVAAAAGSNRAVAAVGRKPVCASWGARRVAGGAGGGAPCLVYLPIPHRDAGARPERRSRGRGAWIRPGHGERRWRLAPGRCRG
jgi:hypothetical protein